MPNIGKDDHPKLWSLIFVLIIALTFCCFVMGQGLNSGTSVFLAGQGYGASLAGVLALVFSIAAALARLFVGPVIDNGKCSLVIIAGIAILIAGTALSAVVQGIPLFTISRLLQGVGFGAATTAASTAAASVLPQERLGEGIGYHGLGQAIAMSIGPAFALYLVGTDPSTNLYVGLALVGFAGLVIALNARYESKWQTLPSSSAYRIKMETRLELDSKDGQAPSPTTVTTSETINSEKYPEGDQVSKRTLRDSFNIFEPRALPGAIPQMIMCPHFWLWRLLCWSVRYYSRLYPRRSLLHHQRGKHDYHSHDFKAFHGHRTCNQNNDRSRRVRHPLLPYATCRTVRGTCLPGVRNLLWSRHWHKPAT